MIQKKLPVLISYGEEVYRPAGYRVPSKEEIYVGSDGHVKRASAVQPPQGQRLILRVLDVSQDFKESNV